MKVFFALIYYLSLAIHAQASGITVQAMKTDSSPVIDGVLQDPIWQKGDWHSGFSRYNNPDALAKAQTFFKVAADESALYFAVRAEVLDWANQVARVTQRDGKVSADECIEIMLGADPNGSQYLHFVVNPLGALYDALVFNEGNEQHRDWNGDITVGAGRESNAWTVELRLPLVEVGITAHVKQAWLFNVARERHSKVTELSSFAPMVGSFHRPLQYASLRLPKIDLSPFLWSVHYPSNFRFEPKGNSLTCEAKTRIGNQTGQSRSFLLGPKWIIDGHEARGRDVPGVLANGEVREISFAFPVTKQGQGTLVLEVRDQQQPDTLWAVRKRAMKLSYVPLDIEVISPCYRNHIYATQSLHEIRAVAHLAVGPDKQADADLRARLAPAGKPENPVVEKRFAIAGSQTEIVLPIPPLDVGPYVLTVRLQRGEEVLEQSETLIRKLPRVAHEWRLDEYQVLLHNGEPFLPFGWFSPEIAVMTRPDCPYTAGQSYIALWQSVQQNLALLDQYAAAGKVLTLFPYPNANLMAPPTSDHPLSGSEAAALRQRVRQLKAHPGLFAWYMADEPEVRSVSVKRLEQVYNIVSDEDPYHPCIMLNDTVTGIYTYTGGGDILMPDPYPCFLQNGFAALPIEKVTRFLRACNEAGGGKQAVWITPQAFNYGDGGRENNRAPTFMELRNMLYQSVVQGAKGFLFYTWAASQNYISLQLGMPFLAKEAADLKAAILSPEAKGHIEVDAEVPEHLHCSTRKVKDAVYVFAVNTATRPQNVRFVLKDKRHKVGQLYLVSEDRSVPVAENGVFTDHFAIYDTHIYTSQPHVAQRATLSAVQAEIDRRDAARKKPGNLAFEDYGTTVSISSKTRHGSTPNRLVDGIQGGMCWRDDTPGKYPDWVELTWPKAVAIGRVVIFSDTVQELAISVADGKAWRQVATKSNARGPQITLTFPPVTTDRLRIAVSTNHQRKGYTIITEIEVYAR